MKRISGLLLLLFAALTFTACTKKVYTVTFDAQGGEPVPAAVEVKSGDKVAEPEAPSKPLSDTQAFDFAGWFTDAEATEENKYDFSKAVKSNLTLYAGWKARDLTPFAVNFNVNGGSAIEPKTVLEGQPIGTLPTAEREGTDEVGYVFEGWYSDEGLTTKVDITALVFEDLTVYAKWDERVKHVVTIVLNNGEENIIERVIDGFTLAKPEDPVKPDEGEVTESQVEDPQAHPFLFKGWYLDETFKTEVDFTKKVEAPFTIYAKFIPEWRIFFDTKDADVEERTQKVEDGRKGLLPRPVTDTHRVKEWLIAGTETVYDFDTPVDKNIFLEAVWAKRVFHTITFDSAGGSAVEDLTVEEGFYATAPEVPTKASEGEVAYAFQGWFESGSDVAFSFAETPITEDIQLVAKWQEYVKGQFIVNFHTKTAAVVPSQPVSKGGVVSKPADPTRVGYVFKGWFKSARGLTWLEPEAVQFPLTIAEDTEADELDLYAYWEPVNSKTHNYKPGETYVSSMTSDSVVVLNPLTYQWSHESEFIDMLATSLYSTEVDWGKAIKDGVAAFPGDFSKIRADEEGNKKFSIEALDYHNILVGAKHFPIDSQGDEHLKDGKYDREAASTFKDTKWRFVLREDIIFEDGTPVNADVYEYSLKQYLDPIQNNFRANLYYRTAENKNGYPIKNAFEYKSGDAAWETVGFKKIGEFEFEIETSEEITQAQAVGFGNIRLVHPDKYEASLRSDKTKSTYGTPESPYMSYGAYVIKSWDENQKIVFNKNYDYVLKGTINYKSRVIQVVDNVDQRMVLFKNGELSVAGLSQDYYAGYVESENMYTSWDGYPQYLIVNLADAKKAGAQAHPEIMYNPKFRQALLYGFNRGYFATNIYAPNTPSLLPIPLDTKQYIQDPNYYSQTPQHLGVLEGLEIEPTSHGYIPELAKNYLEQARTEAGVTGKTTLRFLIDNNPFSLNLANYVKSSYETLFGADKLEIKLDILDAAGVKEKTENWDFDLSLNSVGFGSSNGAWWQYQAIAFFGDMIGGGGLGLSQPHDNSAKKWVAVPADQIEENDVFAVEVSIPAVTDENLVELLTAEKNPKELRHNQLAKVTSGNSVFYAKVSDLADYYHEIITIDMENTWEFLEDLGMDEMEDKKLTGHIEMYNMLKEELDEEGNVVKAAGIYKGTLADIALIQVFDDSPLEATAKEPYPGASVDASNMLAEFEKLFFKHVPLIPTVTRSSAVVYADNVVIEWPEYSSAFGWGAERYRYLNTDVDFQ